MAPTHDSSLSSSSCQETGCPPAQISRHEEGRWGFNPAATDACNCFPVSRPRAVARLRGYPGRETNKRLRAALRRGQNPALPADGTPGNDAPDRHFQDAGPDWGGAGAKVNSPDFRSRGAGVARPDEGG